ncbi:hypothetical protein GLW20_02080 [Virgibacillus halodenitrificans]|nr:hypothetical protein [Virgibacillus halodenitrificans]
MLQKYFYGTLAILGFIALFVVDITMIVPLTTNPIIVSAVVFVFYLYLSYLILFRKII